MSHHTIARLYPMRATAETVVRQLEAAGISHNDISIVTNDSSHSQDEVNHDVRSATSESGAAAGAGGGVAGGAIFGGGVGLMTGLGMLAIPGVGPVVAAGWIVATLAGAGAGAAVGAAAGGLIGALTGAGVPENEAHVYAEGVRRGDSLVTVRVSEADKARAEAIMVAQGPADWHEYDRTWRTEGWDGFDPHAPTYVKPAQDHRPATLI